LFNCTQQYCHNLCFHMIFSRWLSISQTHFFSNQYSLSLFSFVLNQTKIHCIYLGPEAKTQGGILAVPGRIKGTRSGYNCFGRQKNLIWSMRRAFGWWDTKPMLRKSCVPPKTNNRKYTISTIHEGLTLMRTYYIIICVQC